ncbi:hypothetical protein HBHAL_3325 [Halobacillus halophilus DSM 2266]|uniref:Uncharacterized protein n=1 Tax=Halobacillus halophilus (strain ATCC 35676 / DSM 2266 / JCM 20832 / KCTC 3685 / LMG 17431 / NBRC 102448 / NCIMB 2269) TaxID=866895 RepID=I0JNF0_HALH3|nr:hypothetical protein HBHAL_2443 [Halobacillus halophilus DSM 2266]CCG45670.1 hypothetical protein HBHAL_3325 [Halobacillus halophilus DSM 2266]
MIEEWTDPSIGDGEVLGSATNVSIAGIFHTCTLVFNS